MSGFWSRLTALFKGGNNSSNKPSGKKKKSVDGNSHPDYTVHKAPRSYDEIDLPPPEEREQEGTVDYTVEKKPRNYEEVVLPEDNRLSQNQQPVLNYVEVEFKNPTSNKLPVQKKDSKTEYADVTVKNKTVIVN